MKSEESRNVLLIELAVRLQRLVKNLPGKHISAERITRKSLAESYFSRDLSNSPEGARKKADRYMAEMERLFGLQGSESAGYVMAQKFDTFRNMFAFWLEKISPPGKSDKRLHVMLNGLIHTIDNAFTNDPIVIPELARQLKEKYGNKNIRDTREPLRDLFDNYYFASWLQLTGLDDDELSVDTSMDPLLLRLKPRSEVGGNEDISINLARPGRIHVIFDHALRDIDPPIKVKLQLIAHSVYRGEIWLFNGEEFLPCILYREGKDGEIMLTMRNLDRDRFEEITVSALQETPHTNKYYTPFNLDEKIWASFKQLVN